MACLPTPCHRGSATGLNADDLCLRMAVFGDQASSTHTAAQPDWHQDDIGLGKLLEDFPGHRGHPCNQQGFVGRMDVASCGLTGEFFDMFTGRVKIPAFFN